MARGHFAKDQLKSFVERVERLLEERKATSDDIRDVFSEARGSGFDVKALKTIIKMRAQDADERREQAEVIDLYMNALGMLPLFERAAGADDFGKTKVTIEAGGKKVETTAGDIKRAADFVGTKEGKKALREAAKKSGVGEIISAG